MSSQQIGEGYTPAYQISATPFVTSSTLSISGVYEVTFPQVSRFITIRNRNVTVGHDLYVGFTDRGISSPILSNYFIVGPGESYSEEFRVDRLFLSNSSGADINYTILAGLTGIRSSQFCIVTASNGFAGVG